MSDANQYVNTYLDLAMTMLHDNLNADMRLKTELKMANDLLAAQSQEIERLNQQIESVTNEKSNYEHSVAQGNEAINKARADAQQWEAEVNAVRQKVGMLETLQNQYTDLKKAFLAKEEELEKLKQSIAKKAAKKAINKEDTKSSSIPVKSAVMKVEEPKETDDF